MPGDPYGKSNATASRPAAASGDSISTAIESRDSWQRVRTFTGWPAKLNRLSIHPSHSTSL